MELDIGSNDQLGKPVIGFLARAGKMLINGQWLAASSDKTLDVMDPATGRVIAAVAAGDKPDVDKAVVAARKALESSAWSNMLSAAREKLLLKPTDLVEKHTHELVERPASCTA